jgi:hypothetical protein
LVCVTSDTLAKELRRVNGTLGVAGQDKGSTMGGISKMLKGSQHIGIGDI